MDKRIIYITALFSLFLLFSCANNKHNKNEIMVSEPIEKTSEVIVETHDIIKEEEKEAVIEINKKQASFLKIEKYPIVLKKLNEGIELYKLLSDSKIEKSFKTEIKSDLQQVFDDSKWGEIKGEIKNFKLIVTETGAIKGVFEVGDKKYSTLVAIKTSKQVIEGKEKESVKIYYADLLLIK